MSRPQVKSTHSTAGKFDCATDVKSIGTGENGFRNLFSPKKLIFSKATIDVNIKEKDYRSIL